MAGAQAEELLYLAVPGLVHDGGLHQLYPGGARRLQPAPCAELRGGTRGVGPAAGLVRPVARADEEGLGGGVTEYEY